MPWWPALACLACGPAWAQATPPRYGSGDAERGVQQPLPAPPRVLQVPAPAVVAEPPDTGAGVAPGGETLHVDDIVLDGAVGVPEAEWRAFVAPFRGRDLTLAQIDGLARQLTAWMRVRGALLARVIVPPQDARSGHLRLTAIPGRLERVTVRNRSRLADDRVRQAFDPLLDEPVVLRPALEEALLQVGALPGSSLPRLTLAPGSAPGFTELQVDVGPAPAGGGQVVSDNWGSRYSGRDRLGAQVHLDSPFGRGDQLSASGMTTSGGGLLNGRVAYASPLGGRGLGGEIAWSKTTYELGSDYAALGATGEARSLEARWTLPLRRSNDERVLLQGGVARRHLTDRVETGDLSTAKQSTAATLGLQADRGDLQAGVQWTWGHLAIPDAAQRADNEAGVDSVGSFSRLNVDLGWQWRWAGGWQLAATLAWQQALVHRNLDASEQMAIAGTGGVRAYREAVTGDDGLLASLRLQRALPAWGGVSQALGGFADWGRVRPERRWTDTERGTRLADVGLSYEARAGAFFAHLEAARTVGPRPDVGDAQQGRWRALLQAGWIF